MFALVPERIRIDGFAGICQDEHRKSIIFTSVGDNGLFDSDTCGGIIYREYYIKGDSSHTGSPLMSDLTESSFNLFACKFLFSASQINK